MTKSPGNSQPDQAGPFDTTGWLSASYLTSGTKTSAGASSSCVLGFKLGLTPRFLVTGSSQKASP
jgi:hypothetical protein